MTIEELEITAANTATELVIPAGVGGEIMLQCRDSVDVLVATAAARVNGVSPTGPYATIFADGSINLPVHAKPTTQSIFFWCTTTTVIEYAY